MKKSAFIIAAINLLMYCNIMIPLQAQESVGPDRNTLVAPVDIPLFLAGNFGEPRANHFHSGIDIKTNGATGVSVRSVADGYISRIKVEGGGYGNAVYIRHPNGFTSLYGHLLSFNDQITSYVSSEQYRRESFAVDLFPDPSRLVIKKGQIIALSGNSGSSEGPHLHFELRETQSENPINPLVRSIGVTDAIPPVISKFFIYSIRDRRDRVRPVSVSMKLVNNIYQPAIAGPVPFDKISGIGIETYDMLNGSTNHCGVYKIKGYLGDELFFESCLDEISFAETRYMNSFMDYKSYIGNHRYILKLFIDPNNQASIYRFARNRGRLELPENEIREIKVIVEDAAGNQSVAVFPALLDPSKFVSYPDFSPEYNAFFNYQESNTFAADGIELTLPAGALYEDIYFDYSNTGAPPGSYSPLHGIHHPDVPLHQYYRLAIEAVNLPERLRNKATIAQYNGNNRYSSLGGSWEGNRLVTRTRNFGSFCIRVDTVKPVITPSNFTTAAELKTLNSIKFTIRDNFSGIQSYRGEIDGKWILFEYDPKNSALTYRFDSQKIATGVQHKLVLNVTDQLANKAGYTISFFR